MPIVELPEANTELIASSLGEDITVRNRDQLAGTYAIRKLATDAKEDIDLALIDVARGEYEGVTLSLATPQELRERRTTATTAYQRETIREGRARVY